MRPRQPRRVMSGSVLVDTSAWVEFFRHGTGDVAGEVARLVSERRAAVCGPVAAELLRGAKGKREKKVLEDLLEVAPWLGVEEPDWLAAGRLGRKLARGGAWPGLVDLVIAAAAIRSGVPVLTLDKHFAAIAAVSKLALHSEQV